MVQTCLACKNLNEDQKNEYKSYHRFPKNKPDILEKWLANMKFVGRPNTWHRLCSNHFDDTCYKDSHKRLLKRNAIPTIFHETASSNKCIERNKTTSKAVTMSQVFTMGRSDLLKPYHSNTTSCIDENYDVMNIDVCNEVTISYSTRNSKVKFENNILNVTEDHSYCMIRSCNSLLVQSQESDADIEMLDNYCEVSNVDSKHVNLNVREDHPYSRSQSPETFLLAKLQESKEHIDTLRKKVVANNQRVRRLKRKVDNLKDVVIELREKNHIDSNFAEHLENTFSSVPLAIFKRLAKNKAKNKKLEKNDCLEEESDCDTEIMNDLPSKVETHNVNNGIAENNEKICYSRSREKYCPEVRAFALTLHFHSTRAYEYVRKTFDLALPSTSTLRSWYSSVDAGQPGFCGESFEILKLKVQSCKKNNLPPPIVAFMLDDASIKSGVEFNGKEWSGFVDLGNGIDDDDRPLAKQVMVFMVVAIDSSWKLPIAYFFIDSLSGKERANLVSEALCRLHSIGIEVVSLTCDGPSCHFTMCKYLGASLDLPKPTCSFPHPADNSKRVNIFLDACHMLKLCRNCLADKKVLYTAKGEAIRWRFIEELHKLREVEVFRAGNKLRSRHVNFQRQKMKVNLAAQTISDSVADAIEFCNNTLKMNQFYESAATVEYLRIFNRAFDHLNSRNPWGKHYKSPLRPSTELHWRPFFNEAKQYILELKNEAGQFMYKSKNKTAFVGFYVCLESVESIYDYLCAGVNPRLKYLLTYKLSQDHLELFFCAVKARGGWNNNPTCSGFISAFKRLLVRNEIRGGQGNITSMDETKILFVTKSNKNAINTKTIVPNSHTLLSPNNIDSCDFTLERSSAIIDTVKISENIENLDCHRLFSLSSLDLSISSLSLFSENTVAYIAGSVARSLKKKFDA